MVCPLVVDTDSGFARVGALEVSSSSAAGCSDDDGLVFPADVER